VSEVGCSFFGGRSFFRGIIPPMGSLFTPRIGSLLGGLGLLRILCCGVEVSPAMVLRRRRKQCRIGIPLFALRGGSGKFFPELYPWYGAEAIGAASVCRLRSRRACAIGLALRRTTLFSPPTYGWSPELRLLPLSEMLTQAKQNKPQRCNAVIDHGQRAGAT